MSGYKKKIMSLMIDFTCLKYEFQQQVNGILNVTKIIVIVMLQLRIPIIKIRKLLLGLASVC